eukprot:7702114-Pyramimonas_sp.AAC.1
MLVSRLGVEPGGGGGNHQDSAGVPPRSAGARGGTPSGPQPAARPQRLRSAPRDGGGGGLRRRLWPGPGARNTQR